MLILRKDNNRSQNFGSHKNEEPTLKKEDIKGDYRNLVDKSLNTRSCARDGLSGYITQNRLFASE